MLVFELWAGKAIKCSELSGLFYGSLDDKNTERNANGRDLVCEVSEGSRD